jgi:hypothetical protein
VFSIDHDGECHSLPNTKDQERIASPASDCSEI